MRSRLRRARDGERAWLADELDHRRARLLTVLASMAPMWIGMAIVLVPFWMLLGRSAAYVATQLLAAGVLLLVAAGIGYRRTAQRLRAFNGL